MKKWMYIIFPGAMLALFLAFYFSEGKKTTAREASYKAEAARIASEKKAEKDRLETKAREDSKKRSEQRAADEAAKQAKIRADWEKTGLEIQDAINEANAKSAQHNKKISELTRQLTELRAQKEKSNRELLELDKALELAKIGRRNAELEVLRMAEMVAKRATDSSLTKLPPPPAPAS